MTSNRSDIVADCDGIFDSAMAIIHLGHELAERPLPSSDQPGEWLIALASQFHHLADHFHDLRNVFPHIIDEAFPERAEEDR
jgi:hypothetical protein